MNQYVQKLLTVAQSQVGYLEKNSNSQLDNFTANAGYNNWTKYARDLDRLGVYNGPKNGYAWCDIFVDWCFVNAFGVDLAWKITNQKMKGEGAGCTYSARYYKAMNRFDKNPQPGDQIFFTRDNGVTMYHTGIVEKIDNTYIYTIEGNTSTSSGVIANGGGVFRKKYVKNYNQIGGYGHPNWDILDSTQTPVEPPKDNEEMTQAEFNKMMDQWLVDTAKIITTASWSANEREWAENKKYIQGDTEGNMMYKKFITREEMIVILYRIFSALNLT